jgi:hypothetical protein
VTGGYIQNYQAFPELLEDFLGILQLPSSKSFKLQHSHNRQSVVVQKMGKQEIATGPSPTDSHGDPPAYSSPLVPNAPSDDPIVARSHEINDGALPEVVTSAMYVPDRKETQAPATTISPMSTGTSETSKTPPIAPIASRMAGNDTPTLEAVYPTPPDAGTSRSNISVLGPSDATTVTPLHMLGNQSDIIDCPFCRRRTETKVKLTASKTTHKIAAGLFFTTLGGVVAPYKLNWKSNVSHYCSNCEHKVAYRKHGEEDMKPLGTPEHMREASRFPAAG